MKHCILTTLLLVFAANTVFAQVRGAELISPRLNEEICLGSSLPIRVKYRNRDSFAQTLAIRIKITNVVTGITIYAKSYTIPDAPAGYSVDTTFEPFVTEASNLSHLGSFRACANIDALDEIGDIDKTWPFADSMCKRIFVIRKTSIPFRDPFDTYSATASGPIPSQIHWVSIGAKVVDGRKETWDAPPPSSDQDPIPSAVLRLDRADVNGTVYGGSNSGDTLISFPVNLIGQSKAVLSFGFMRAGRHSYPALYDSDTLLGPENTVVSAAKQVVRTGDSLLIEFKDPSVSACEPGKWNRIAAIDGGHDFEFQSFWLALSSDSSVTYRINDLEQTTDKLNHSYLDTAFRFRLRIKAANNSMGFKPNDDTDPWYIDNVSLAVPQLPELEVTWVRVVTPYTKLPLSATSALPVYLKVKNIGSSANVPVPMNVRIISQDGVTAYDETVNFTIGGDGDTILQMPDWNARAHASASRFNVFGKIAQTGFDNNPDDNETSSLFFLNVERGNSAIQEFALDHAGLTPIPGSGNDMTTISDIPGVGIGFGQSSGSMAMKFILTQTDTVLGARLYFGSSNQVGDPIRISVLRGDNSTCIPLDTVSTFTTTRPGVYNQLTACYFPQPVVLNAGVYWFSVSQLAVDNFTLGASFYRGSGSIVMADQLDPGVVPNYTSRYGTQWSPTENSGAVDCMFAVETPAGSGAWLPWMPTTDHWPMNAAGSARPALAWNPQVSSFIMGGCYMPLIRPIVGSVNPPKSDVHALSQNEITLTSFPNPFKLRNSTVISFMLDDAANTSVAIYNALGELVRTVLVRKLDEGTHTLHWDGKDINGHIVTPGVYICRLISDDHVSSIKLIAFE